MEFGRVWERYYITCALYLLLCDDSHEEDPATIASHQSKPSQRSMQVQVKLTSYILITKAYEVCVDYIRRLHGNLKYRNSRDIHPSFSMHSCHALWRQIALGRSETRKHNEQSLKQSETRSIVHDRPRGIAELKTIYPLIQARQTGEGKLPRSIEKKERSVRKQET